MQPLSVKARASGEYGQNEACLADRLNRTFDYLFDAAPLSWLCNLMLKMLRSGRKCRRGKGTPEMFGLFKKEDDKGAIKVKNDFEQSLREVKAVEREKQRWLVAG